MKSSRNWFLWPVSDVWMALIRYELGKKSPESELEALYRNARDCLSTELFPAFKSDYGLCRAYEFPDSFDNMESGFLS